MSIPAGRFRPVLACGWHEVRAHGSEDDRSRAVGPAATPSRICLPGVTSRPAAGSCIHTMPGGIEASSLYWMVTCASVTAELITSRAFDTTIPVTPGMSGAPDSRVVMVDGNRPASTSWPPVRATYRSRGRFTMGGQVLLSCSELIWLTSGYRSMSVVSASFLHAAGTGHAAWRSLIAE